MKKNFTKIMDVIKGVIPDVVVILGNLAFAFIPFIAIMYIFNGASQSIEEKEKQQDNAIKIEQYCVVDDKHTSTEMIGDLITTNHYLDVSAEDNQAIKDSVLVSGAVYSEIEIGSEVKCTILYNDDEVIGIELTE